ncbi:MAG: hypothetical protein GXX98_01550 [Planctomycetes bacterium]|nr:hypothetical protein [Planctomycetota bacterium]
MRNTQTTPSSETVEAQERTCTTGIEKLDELLSELPLPDLAAIHGCTQAAVRLPSLGKRIVAYTADLLDRKRQQGQIDIESERLPIETWGAFLAGIDAGTDDGREIGAVDPGASAQRRFSIDKAHADFAPVAVWLTRRTFREKLTAVLLTALVMHENALKSHACYDGDAGNDLLRDWEADLAETPDDTTEDAYIRGYTNALLSSGV